MGRRLVNLLPVAQRTNAFTYGVVGRTDPLPEFPEVVKNFGLQLGTYGPIYFVRRQKPPLFRKGGSVMPAML